VSVSAKVLSLGSVGDPVFGGGVAVDGCVVGVAVTVLVTVAVTRAGVLSPQAVSAAAAMIMAARAAVLCIAAPRVVPMPP
jgi:hypothetical protein